MLAAFACHRPLTRQDDALLPNTYMVVRVDGRGFTKFCDAHGFAKPNDPRGLALMTAAAAHVMREWGDMVLAYGVSDEYSFVFPRDATVFGRRAAKIATCVSSSFAAAYVFYWPRFFQGAPMTLIPAFDARCVAYPSLTNICDYVRWRQVDSHINCLYNECFWALVQRGGATTAQAHETLRGTVSEQKHELLFSRFGINYAKLPAMYRRGTFLIRQRKGLPSPPPEDLSARKPADAVAKSSGEPGAAAQPVCAAAGSGAAAPAAAPAPSSDAAAVVEEVQSPCVARASSASDAAVTNGSVPASGSAAPSAGAASIVPDSAASALAAAASGARSDTDLVTAELTRLMQIVELPPSVRVSHADLLRGRFLQEFFGAFET